MKKLMTPWDKILLGVLSLGTLASYALMQSFSASGSTVLVEVDEIVVYRARLDHDQKVSVPGRRGTVSIEIRDAKVAVIESDCPNRICIRMGWRNQVGDVIVCVPNGLIVKITTNATREVRAITG